MFKRKMRGFVFEGPRAEEYKRTKNKWIRLAFAGSILPVVIGIITSIFNDTFRLLDFFGDGELILSLFTLNLPMTFDLFEIKHKDDEKLSWAFWLCVVVIIAQVVLYSSIKSAQPNNDVKIKSVVASVAMIFVSIGTCFVSLKVLFYHTIDQDGGIE